MFPNDSPWPTKINIPSFSGTCVRSCCSAIISLPPLSHSLRRNLMRDAVKFYSAESERYKLDPSSSILVDHPPHADPSKYQGLSRSPAPWSALLPAIPSPPTETQTRTTTTTTTTTTTNTRAPATPVRQQSQKQIYQVNILL